MVNPPLVYPPGFGHHHHHVGDDGLVVEDYDCDGNVDDDLGVTLVYKDTKTNIYFVSGFKKTRKYLYELLELLFPQRFCVRLGLK